MKFIIAILTMVLLTINAFGASSASMVWTFNSASSGSMVNSCGFDSSVVSPGTDYSISATNNTYGASDLATSNGTTNPCVVTAASHNFVAADNGNTIHIASGGTFTPNWYTIVSTSGNAATLDKACASGASTSAGVWKEGGGCNFGSATLDASFFASATTPIVAGNTVCFKGGGTYTTAATISSSVAGTTTAPVKMRGYTTTCGDTVTQANRPLIDLTSFTFTSAANWDYSDLSVKGTAALMFGIAANVKVVGSKFINSSTTTTRVAFNIPSGATNNFVMGNEMSSYRGKAVGSASTALNNTLIGNYMHDSDICYTDNSTTSTTIFINNILDNCVTAGFQLTGAKTGSLLAYNNTVYGSANKTNNIAGFSFAAGTTNVRLVNNIVSGWTTGVSHADAGQLVSLSSYNDYFLNTTNGTNFSVAGVGDVTSNPTFTAVTQKTGSTATISGSVLTDTNATFTTAPAVVANRDVVYIVSGTAGPVFALYGITGVTATTLTLDSAPGDSATADHLWQTTAGHNFGIGTPLRAIAFPGNFPAAISIGYLDVGAVQRRERITTGGSH